MDRNTRRPLFKMQKRPALFQLRLVPWMAYGIHVRVHAGHQFAKEGWCHGYGRRQQTSEKASKVEFHKSAKLFLQKNETYYYFVVKTFI